MFERQIRASNMIPTLQETFLSGAIALVLVLTVYAFFDVRRSRLRVSEARSSNGKQPATFLFQDKALRDATETATRLIRGKFDSVSDWEAMLLVLRDDFPNLEGELASLSPDHPLVLASCFDYEFQLTATLQNGNLKIVLAGLDEQRTPDFLQKLEERNLRKELEVLRSVAEAAPQLIWQQNDKGEVVWCNNTYLRFADLRSSTKEAGVKIWPAKDLFPQIEAPDSEAKVALKSRHSLKVAGDDAEHWFNIVSVPSADGTLHFATDANEQLRSERGQKAFIQTFAKTFAELSVGLAIFDKSRHLSMFNPALLEMSGLPASLLSSRPSIETVFNRMREAGKLPEPKDYTQWRDQFSRLLDEASTGTYQETWVLPDGQTHRVTGRPHPDGAIAFLFEDISAEISLTRKFRTEIETSQAVLDTLPEAIAVFSPSKTLIVTNDAYQTLWGEKTDDVSLIDLRSCLRVWKSGSAPSGIWSGIEAFSDQPQDRFPSKENFVLSNGRAMTCHLLPISGGMTMVKFAGTHRPKRRIHLKDPVSQSLALRP